MVDEPMTSEETLSFDLYHPQPLVVVISGPSGVGKDAVVKSLQARDQNLRFVVTMTSRKPRDGEVDGVDYLFVTKEEFEARIVADEFAEHALVYTDYKGVPKAHINEALDSEKDVILRVDVQGAQTLRRNYPGAVLIFLIPSNQKDWFDWLRQRKSETKESMAIRLETARQELTHLPEFDYVVVNEQGKLDKTVDTIQAIIEAEHHRVHPRKAVE